MSYRQEPHGVGPSETGRGHRLELPDSPVRCAICGSELSGDPDDQPFPPLGPMCGECYRSQQMDDEIDASTDEDENDDAIGF
jgi:hypothetical protein